MRKKILVAVDPSICSRYAMQYAARLAEQIREVDFVLFHVQPTVSSYLVDEAMKRPQARAELDKLVRKNREAARALLEECRKYMTDAGVPAGAVEVKTMPRVSGIAEDIVNTAQEGAYDAVLVGRRGIGGLQEIFLGSVTAGLLACSRVIPVWVVDGPVESQNMAIAIDGSTQSLRVVDHVAHILSDAPDARLTFLNVEPRLGDFAEIDPSLLEAAELEAAVLTANQQYVADFMEKAAAMLAKAGIAKDRVPFKTVKSRFFAGRAILEELKTGGFGTVAVGKTGTGNSHTLGKVAGHITQKLSNAAVWVVP